MGAEHAMEVALIGEAQLVCSVRNGVPVAEELPGFLDSCVLSPRQRSKARRLLHRANQLILRDADGLGQLIEPGIGLIFTKPPQHGSQAARERWVRVAGHQMFRRGSTELVHELRNRLSIRWAVAPEKMSSLHAVAR